MLSFCCKEQENTVLLYMVLKTSIQRISGKKVQLFVFALMSIVLAFFVLHTVSAQGGAGISIQPSIFEEHLDPGEEYSSAVRVKNTTASPQVYYVHARDVRKLSDTGQPLFAEPGEEISLGVASWISLPEGPINVGADQTVEIPFTIIVPQDAAPGNHLGGIFVGPKAEKLDVIGAGIGFQVVPLINIQISGNLVEKAEIHSFSTEKLLYGKPVVMFTTIVSNGGNVAVKPRGPIEIKNMFGKTVGSVSVNDTDGLVPPFGERVFTSEWEDDENIFLGRYIATVTLVYGQEERTTIYRSISFWILPMNIILPVVLSLLIFVLGVYGIVRMYIRKNIRAVEEATGRTIKSLPKDTAPLSRLAFIVAILLAFTIIFLLVLLLFGV